MLEAGDLSDMARHKKWSEAAVDLTAIITRRAGVAAQDTARRWLADSRGALLLEGKGSALWRHTEDTSWDVQGRLEEWEASLGDVAARHTRSGSLRPNAAKKLAAAAWPIVVDPEAKPARMVRRRFGSNLPAFVGAARQSLGGVTTAALEIDANRFRTHLASDPDLVEDIERTLAGISALLHGEQPPLESVRTGDSSSDQSGDNSGEERPDDPESSPPVAVAPDLASEPPLDETDQPPVTVSDEPDLDDTVTLLNDDSGSAESNDA